MGYDNQLTADGKIRREDTIATQCRIRLTTRRGEYFADPSIGSRLHLIKITKNAGRQVTDAVREALEPLRLSGQIVSASTPTIEVDHASGIIAFVLEIQIPGDPDIVPVGRFQFSVS